MAEIGRRNARRGLIYGYERKTRRRKEVEWVRPDSRGKSGGAYSGGKVISRAKPRRRFPVDYEHCAKPREGYNPARFAISILSGAQL